MQAIIAFILIFFVVVTVHELGHFLLAKRAGILCQEFAIGFGPKIFHKKIGETNFTIRLLPIGGYVKMPDNTFDFNNDVSPYDLKRGMQVSLKLDNDDRVEKIYIDKSNDMELVPLELNEFDLSEKLFVSGFSGDEIQKYSVKKDACVVFGGMEEQIAPVERMFSSHSWGKKFWTLFAGPLMNFLLTIVIFIGLGIYEGVPSNSSKIKVIDNMSAQKSGLQTDDTIKEINGEKIVDWNSLVQNIKKSNGSEINVVYDRNGNENSLKLVPEEVTELVKGKEVKSYKIGITQTSEHNILEAVSYGLKQTLFYGTQIFMGIIGLFVSLFKGGFSLDQLGGPVAIYELSSNAAKSGIVTSLKWMAILSVNLGLMNLIPIPVLDGGRIMFVIYEAIFKKPISKKVQYYATITFSLLLFALMLAVTWNDIQRLFR